MKETSVCESVVAHPHVNVLGVDVSAINMDRAIDLAARWIATGQSGYICMSGVHGVTEAQSNMQLRHILNNAVINAPDGMPMSWIGWLRGHTQMDRVYGPGLYDEPLQTFNQQRVSPLPVWWSAWRSASA